MELYNVSALICVVLGCWLTGVTGELCSAPDQITSDDMTNKLHPNSIPRGQLHAGYFEQDVMATDPANCIISCCNKPLCNVAWFTHNDLCFTIECNPDNKTACEPYRMNGPAFNGSVFVQVRSLADTATANECDMLHDDEDCAEDQKCVVTHSLVSRCQCRDGLVRESLASKKCVPETEERRKATTKSPSRTRKPTTEPPGMSHSTMSHSTVKVKGCTFGLMDCDENEDCVLAPNSHSKYGICQCRVGYTKDTEGNCIAAVTTKSPYGEVTPVKGATPTPGPSKHTGDAGKSTKGVTPSPSPKAEMLTVSAGDNKVVQLPENGVTLKAFALPEETKDNPYSYDWTLVAHPEGTETGKMVGKNTDTLVLSQLIAGLYKFRVQVTGNNKFGEAQVNVTVKPPARVNEPPVAKITPSELEVKLPNTAILDGSDSTDDDKIVKWQWEETSGPLHDTSFSGDSAILHLKNLAAGKYTFKLTVTDSDGLTNSTTASVVAIQETDYPPKANAGSDIVVHLPQKSVVLYGNQSTDDKQIASYEWIKASGDKLAADMQGTRTSELHLSNLEVGDYTFTLKVTDSAGQVSTADVHVYVKPEVNTAPVAVTYGNIETSLPLDNILLDGANSTDDEKITSYLWQQTGGPTILKVKDADQAVATAGGEIKVGDYKFMLTVKDSEGLTASDTVTVHVKQVANEVPVAHAGGDVVVQLPRTLVTLDGSKSTDDHKITEYHWVRDQKSLAAGDVVNQSDHQAVLQLVNLVAGRYVFTLTVMDDQGLSNSDTANVVVRDDTNKKQLLELMLDTDLGRFTVEHKTSLEGQLKLLLPKSPGAGDTVVNIQGLEDDPSSGNLRVTFYVMNVMRDSKQYRNGMDTLKILKEKLLSSPDLLDFTVISVDTVICQNNCSSHGHCSLKTKLCVCEAFWTQNFFRYLMYGQSNCDWSILYVVVVCFFIVLGVTGAVWACVCFWHRRRCRCRFRSKKRHRYSLLQDEDDQRDAIEMKKGKIQNSSVMISESDFSSEEETLFVNQKKTNGHLGRLNGVNKQHLKTKLKT